MWYCVLFLSIVFNVKFFIVYNFCSWEFGNKFYLLDLMYE